MWAYLVLIDTNVWSEMSRPRPDPNVAHWMAQHADECILSAIVLAEIQYGIALADAPKRGALQNFVDDLLLRLSGEIVPFGRDAALAWGPMRARLQRAGQLIGDRDMLIAAHAMTLDVPLVTRDVLDMARTGAKLINPWTD